MIPHRQYVTRVESKSGSIKGDFILGSSGVFSSDSGNIAINVLPMIDPAKSHKKQVQTSQFITQTISGSTQIQLLDPTFLSSSPNLKEQRITLPHKPIVVDIPHKAPTNIPYNKINDGDPYLELFKESPGAGKELETNKKDDPDVKLRTLISRHTSKSSRVSVHYPAAWEGVLDATTFAGSIDISGDELEIIRDGRNSWVQRELIARKPKGASGGEASTLHMESTAGSIDFTVG